MRSSLAFAGKPYRAERGVGKWKIYAKDDQGQERFLGTVTEEDDYFYADATNTDRSPEVRADGFEEAVEGLYSWCSTSGYLTQGHDNYLGGQSG